jgi:hypothetical protein
MNSGVPGAAPRRRSVVTTVAAAALLACSASRAEAQWGWGINLQPYTPPSVQMLNQRAAARAGAPRGGAGPSRKIPDRFEYRRQQVAMQQRYDFATRRATEARVPPPPSAPPTRSSPGATASVEALRPDVPIDSFFDAEDRVSWPSDAPTEGDLVSRREQSDLAALATLNQWRLDGLARVDTVTEARRKLVDYGQPALAVVRQQATPRVADTFHLFLLSFYESLGQAATKPRGAGARP